MLSELCIENLAVIKQAVIPFTNEFNVFTGETGAGKSILINGINAVLGKRINKDIVRSGCDKAVVTALFVKLSEQTKTKLDEFGISYDDDELLITREISADGGSTARINSKTSSVSVLREIGTTLVDVHGQHDNQILMYPERHIDIVDNYANLHNVIEDYQTSFKKLQDISRTIKKLSIDEQFKKERLDVLKNIIDEIGSLNISDENEDSKIENEFNIINNSYNISEVLSRSSVLISGDDESSGIIETFESIINDLNRYSDIMPKFNEIIQRIESIKIDTIDIGDELTHINDGISVDNERLDYLEDRRSKLISIKKKYGPELKDVIDKYKTSVAEAKGIINSSDEIEKLSNERRELLIEVSEKAKKISSYRKKAANELSEKIRDELRFLDMPNVKIEFSQDEGKLTNKGMDIMEIMISVNAGEPLKPIAKIASGGELSRIMLAIKNVTAEKDDVPTQIFDEIDTGVSGRAAQKIGVKLREISRSRQVLCVTHLSQIAVMADNHLLIEKNTENDKTITTVTQLDYNQRINEIARILCGDNITEIGLKSAKEQLDTKVNVYNEMLKNNT